MGYNDTKEWLDEHSGLIQDLVDIARQNTVSTSMFNSSRDANDFQFLIRNVLFGLSIHYPAYANVREAVRTWRENNYEAGEFKVHVGTENNYTYRRKGKSAKERRLPTPKVRGRPPEPARFKRSQDTWTLSDEGQRYLAPETPSPDVDIFEYSDPFNMSTIPDVIKPLLNIVDMRNSQQIILSNVDLSVTEAKAFTDSLDSFAYDDSAVHPETGRVVRLTLRRRSTAEV